MSFASVRELIDRALEKKVSVAEIVLEDESANLGLGIDTLRKNMHERIAIMKASMEKGLAEKQVSPSGLTDGKAYTYERWREQNDTSLYGKMIARALAVAEVNACMSYRSFANGRLLWHSASCSHNLCRGKPSGGSFGRCLLYSWSCGSYHC